MKRINLLIVFSLLASSLLFVSCEKEEFSDKNGDYTQLLEDVENLTIEEYTADLAEFDYEEERDDNVNSLMGKRPCFKFVFPISFAVPTHDAPVVINSQEELREFLKNWKDQNSTAVSDIKPQLIFPIEVQLKNGDIKVLNSQEELTKLKRNCSDHKPNIPKYKLCFEPLFPLQVNVPGHDALIEVNSQKELFELMKKWKENHPDSAQHPVIVFPIEVVKDNGDVYTINNMKELKKYLRECIRKLMHGKDWK